MSKRFLVFSIHPPCWRFGEQQVHCPGGDLLSHTLAGAVSTSLRADNAYGILLSYLVNGDVKLNFCVRNAESRTDNS